MPTYNTDVKPTSTGLALGNSNQKWIAYVSNLFADVIQTNTPNQASTGQIRLASLDTIAWRNAANTADVVLSKTNAAATTTPADTLVFSGSGIEGPFLSHNINPASTGELRLAGADGIYFRNQANSGDIAALIHNSDDTVTLGGAGGVTQTIGTFTNLTVTGTLTPGAITGPTTANLTIAAGAVVSAIGKDITLAGGNSTTTAGNTIITGGNGTGGGVTAGGNVNIRGGSGNVPGIIKVGDLNTTSVQVGNTTVATAFPGRVNQYQGITTVKNGILSEVAAVDVTAQTAAITTATLYAVPVDGQYRLSWSAKTTTAATTSSTLGALTIVYTDPDGVAVTLTSAAVIAAGTVATTSTANTTGTVLIGIPQYLNCKGITNVTYAFAYVSTGATPMAYNLHILLEAC